MLGQKSWSLFGWNLRGHDASAAYGGGRCSRDAIAASRVRDDWDAGNARRPLLIDKILEPYAAQRRIARARLF